ncbi:HYR domain-containing protein [Thalassobellus suaedae]|uniref:HYR domain-containing protein n=1 Tax=Thalassobellus suaedae TaxID=3074124 RepID=A0ABY9XYD1_9FLAO|nr:HYR domain-containing protein [Flavobacteriaceae bacterium HL-DH14]
MTPPTISCPDNQSVNTSLDGTGNCTVNFAVVTPAFNDNCSATLTWNMTGAVTASGSGAVGNRTFPIGTTTINYTVTDAAGLTATCSQNITVVDNENPTITCPSDQNVSFDNNCAFEIPDYTTFIEVSTLDNCDSNPTVMQSPAPGTLISSTTTVTLTATDNSNNKSSCSFKVIPIDNLSPTATCKPYTAVLSANGTVTISALDIDNGSYDNCGIINRTVSPSSFNCDNIGDNTVTFTVFDNAGNSDSCTATVTIVDNTAPTMICKNFVVVVNAITRIATIKASDIDNGSNDACGLTSLSVSPNIFPEDPNGNVYTASTTLTAIDVNGNSNTCTATVTVEPPKNQFTYLTGVIVNPTPDNPQPPSALVEATSCPGGTTTPRDVSFTLQPINDYVLQADDVNFWEYSNDNGETWTQISGTAGKLTHIILGLAEDTFVRLNIKYYTEDPLNPVINQTSAEAYVRFLPPDEPPIIVSHTALDICLGEDVTVNAESYFDQPNGTNLVKAVNLIMHNPMGGE